MPACTDPRLSTAFEVPDFEAHDGVAVMKFGVSFLRLAPEHWIEAAQEAEANGFESVWVAEHLIFPVAMPPETPYGNVLTKEHPLTDPWVSLAYIAGATSTIRLATHVYILPLRHPIVSARAIATLDLLSGGRLVVGIGVGWLRPEFEIMGESWEDRGRRTDEIIPLLRRLWTEPEIEHHGEFYSFPPVGFEPKPVQAGGPPIEVGGGVPATLRRAATLGDGWITLNVPSLEALAERISTLQSLRAEAGRTGPFDVTHLGQFADKDTVRRCEEMGVTRGVVFPADFALPGGRRHGQYVGLQAHLDTIHRYADEVM